MPKPEYRRTRSHQRRSRTRNASLSVWNIALICGFGLDSPTALPLARMDTGCPIVDTTDRRNSESAADTSIDEQIIDRSQKQISGSFPKSKQKSANERVRTNRMLRRRGAVADRRRCPTCRAYYIQHEIGGENAGEKQKHVGVQCCTERGHVRGRRYDSVSHDVRRPRASTTTYPHTADHPQRVPRFHRAPRQQRQQEGRHCMLNARHATRSTFRALKPRAR